MKQLSLIPTDFRSRIVLATLSIIIISTLIFGAGVFWNSYQLSEHALISRVRLEADIISQNIATSVIFDDSASAEEILSTFNVDNAIISARLATPTDKHFAYYVHDKTQNTPSQNITLEQRRVIFKGEYVGTLYLQISRDELIRQSTGTLIFLGVALCIVILVAFSIFMPIIKTLLLPLLKLHSVSQQIAITRNYSLRAEVNNHDEVGKLASMFNSMLAQIENRDAMLEKQVAQRTLELEKLAEEFRFRAFHDSLTGLPNRSLLNERFEHSIEHAKRSRNKFACLLLDLDDFKTINDTKGHEFGDELLIEVAKRLRATVRSEDLVCRLGGDEFVILLNDLSCFDDLNTIADKILYQINLEFLIIDESIKTAVSVGGAVFPEHGKDVSTIKRHADVAMYRAKESGKNQFCLFSEGMQEDVKFRLMIQNGLDAALNEKQFELYFQPKVDAFRNTIVGCEALIRWNHPVEGFLTPNKFIPYAEDIGKVTEIDYFVIDSACEHIARWTSELTQPISIAINLSGRHFHDFKIVEVLNQSISKYNVSPSLIDVEITEAVLIADPDKAKKIVHAIKRLGMGISLDDFGTGYSSLEYLRTLPIDTVKLDRAFVKSIDINMQDRRLTTGIVSLARGLNLKMVAEGVETAPQLETLIELGCNIVQGYYFSPPIKNQDFLRWVKQYNDDHKCS